jgi:hypothetical protein
MCGTRSDGISSSVIIINTHSGSKQMQQSKSLNNDALHCSIHWASRKPSNVGCQRHRPVAQRHPVLRGIGERKKAGK